MDRINNLASNRSNAAGVYSDNSSQARSISGLASPRARAMVVDLQRVPFGAGHRRQGDIEGCALSPREREMVELILRGYTDQEMARYYSLSESTINRRTLRIIRKLGVVNKLELILLECSRRLTGIPPSRHPETQVGT